MSEKNFNRIKVVLAEKNLQNKWLAEQLGRPSNDFKMVHQCLSTFVRGIDTDSTMSGS